MARSETITINDREFIVRKFTVRDIREIEERLTKGEAFTIIDAMFPEGLPSAVLFKSLQVGIDDLDELLPEDIKQLMEAVAELNPTYADSLIKRVSAAKEIMSSDLTKPARSS